MNAVLITQKIIYKRLQLTGPLLILGIAAFTLPAKGADTDFSPAQIQTDIAYFASTKLQGRGSGSTGNEAAARYIADRFRKAGLLPIGTSKQRDAAAKPDKSGYFQPFRFHAGREIDRGSFFTIVQDGHTHKLRYGKDWKISPISSSGEASGSVIFAGYGIRDRDGKRNDYSGLDVKGKLVLVLAGSPEGEVNRPLIPFADIRSKALTARELGASGLILILPKDNDMLSLSGKQLGRGFDAGLPVLQLTRSSVSLLTGASGGSTTEADRLQTAADKGEASGPIQNLTVKVHAAIKSIESTTANIAGLLPGSDPVLKDELVVIGAHMDHLGLGGPGSGSLDASGIPTIHPGADDNASGSAGLLALVNYFQHAARPKRSILFLSFSGEELGLLGSAYYVQNPLLPLNKTAAMLNMDMVGRLRDNNLTVIGTGTAREWPMLLTEANRASKLKLSLSESGFGGSDHQSFFTHGVPVLFFFTGMHPEYHTPRDVASLINSQGEAQVLGLVRDCAEWLANSPTRPTYQKETQPQTNGSRRGFRVYLGSIPDYSANVTGVALEGVRPGSPADKGGLKAGDIIIKFAGKEVRNVEEYTAVLQTLMPGDNVEVVVKRGAETVTLHVTLGTRPG